MQLAKGMRLVVAWLIRMSVNGHQQCAVVAICCREVQSRKRLAPEAEGFEESRMMAVSYFVTKRLGKNSHVKN